MGPKAPTRRVPIGVLLQPLRNDACLPHNGETRFTTLLGVS